MRSAGVVVFLLALALSIPLAAQPDRIEPGSEAAAAYELLESEDTETKKRGCESFIAQVRRGSADPWAYLGAVLCIDRVEGLRETVEKAFAAVPEDSALGLYGRGYLAFLGGDLETAELLLQRAVTREPRLALAWDALEKLPGLPVGSVEAPQPDRRLPPKDLARVRLRTGIFDRLDRLLSEIPLRWETLPEPRVPLSGKDPHEVLAGSQDRHIRAAMRFISVLAESPPNARGQLIDDWLEENEPTEVDVWIPGLLAEQKRLRSPREAAVTVEAWLQWSEKLGRKDALLWAASDAIHLIVRQRGILGLDAPLRSWGGLAAPKVAAYAMAQMNLVRAQILFRLGDTEEALSTYNNALKLFQDAGSQLGQGKAWLGEADVVFRLGDNEAALNAYRKARELLQTVDYQLGRGDTWIGEATVLLRLGDNEGALNAYRKGRKLFQAVGSQFGRGNTLKGEADVLFRWGDNKGALSAYRKARQIFLFIGSQFGQGNTLKGEADVLFRLGNNEGALSAYRSARDLFRLVGDQFGQGNSLKGEADVLFLLGNNRGALSAYRTARQLFQGIDSQFGQGDTWLGEANVLFRLGNNEGALSAYRNARELFQAVGDQLGQGNTLKGEAAVLFRLGDNSGALNSYRHARELFQIVGDQLGQGNTWLGEADVFFRLGNNEEALDTYRRTRQIFQDMGSQLDQGNTWLGEANVLFRLGNNEEALSAYHTACELFQTVGDQLGQANSRRGEADVLFRLGDNKGALSTYRNTRRLFHAVGDQLGQGDTWRGEADILFRLGDNEEALSAYHKARELFQAVGDQLGKANSWRGEANVLFRLGDNEGALDAYRQARELCQAVGDQLGKGTTWLGEANVLFRLGANKEALSACHQARRLYKAAGSDLGQGQAYKCEADVLLRRGDTGRSLSAYRKARELFQAVGSQLDQGNTWRGEADVLFRLGDNRAALSAYRNARELYRSVDSQLGQGNTWQGQADVLFRLGKHEGALSAYRNARELFQTVGDQRGQGNTWGGEADVLFRLGKHEGALSAYRKARQLYQAVGSQLGQGNTWRGEAEVLLAKGRAAEAAKAAGRGAELAASQGAKGSEIRSLLVEARARLQLVELEQVADLAQRATERFGEMRGGFVTDAQRTGQESSINSAYDLLIPTLWHLGRPLAALERAEQARSRVLLDLVATRHAARSREAGVALDLLQQREELASELAAIAKDLAEEPPPKRQQELIRKRAVLDAQAERLGFESLLSAGSPLASAEPLDREGIRSTMHEVGPILVYYVVAEQTFVFLLLRDEPEPVVRVLDLSKAEFHRRARQLAEALANPNYEHRAEELKRELWTALLGPLSDHLPPGGALTLILHGPLHQVPFEALVDPEGKPLLERFDLAVAPSISTLHHVRARHRPARADDGLVALASGTGLTLPAAEIRKIAAFFDPSRAAAFAHAMARYRAYERLAPRARHLLIASQGAHLPGSRRLTYLEIEPSDAHDGRLTAAEIAGLPIDAELVTLAACDTAYAKALLSDERLDLTRAYLVAGAAAVLATRWKVPEDYRTSRFLVDFYRAYRQGGPEGRGLRKDQALTEARRRSRKRGDPAQIWAAWVLVGDAR